MERCRDTDANGGFVGAFSDTMTNFITICPRTFTSYTAVAPATKDQDMSASGVYIERVRSLATTLFHETMHLLYNSFSEWFSPLTIVI